MKTISSVRCAKVWAADIQITPNGKFLYSTDRTTSKIALLYGRYQGNRDIA
jgi:6-phosphogluconolactonase (cycloisomerase 2 family)